MLEQHRRTLEAGNEARAARPIVTRFVDTLQNEILNSLLTQYTSGTLTDQMARGMIGEIAGLEKITIRLAQQIREADNLDEELHGGESTS